MRSNPMLVVRVLLHGQGAVPALLRLVRFAKVINT
jgi:hypothetical protein